jgi:hypothetical protein
MTETFRRSLRGTVHSSDHSSVRVQGRTGVRYRDASRRLVVDSELMAVGYDEIVVYERSIPDDGQRDMLLGRIVKALEFDGLRVIVESR